MRILDHPLLGTLDKERISFSFNGVDYEAVEGESIAAALLANSIRIIRYSEKLKKPRGIYCGIGHCYECRVTIDGQKSVRACITNVQDKMQIHSQCEVKL